MLITRISRMGRPYPDHIIGTCISKNSFEVGDEVAKQFDEAFVSFNNTKQKHFVDLKAANLKQLQDFGIPLAQIEIAETCTVLNNDSYFSYRKVDRKIKTI